MYQLLTFLLLHLVFPTIYSAPLQDAYNGRSNLVTSLRSRQANQTLATALALDVDITQNISLPLAPLPIPETPDTALGTLTE